MILFRDRFGIKPLYYTEWDGDFYFSSEIKPLLAASPRPAELNRARLATYFTYRYAPGEQTMFKGIRRLPPGTLLYFDIETRRLKVKRYWEYHPDETRSQASTMSLECAAEQYHELFKDAVRIRP